MIVKFLRFFIIFGFLSVGSFSSFEEIDELISIRSERSIQTAFDLEGEGSGEEHEVTTTFATTVSSIKGIPFFNPKFAKWSQFNMPGEKFYRQKLVPITDYNSKKSSHKSFLGNVLSMLGFNLDDTPALQNPEKTIMQVLFNTTKAVTTPLQEIRYAPVRTRVIENTCTPSIEASRTFSIISFMGQWYQVMSTVQQGEYNSCRILNYRLLKSQTSDVGTTFETMEYNSYPGFITPRMTSGFGRQNTIKGEIRFNSLLEDTLVNVIYTGPVNSTGYYQYVILGANCYYPIRVYARDPAVFKRKYQAEVFRVLGKKGLINDISRALNFIKITDFSKCSLPSNIFQY